MVKRLYNDGLDILPPKRLSKGGPTLKQLNKSKAFILGLPIYRSSNIIPFGYKESSIDHKVLLPIDKVLRAIYNASKYIGKIPFTKLAAWITTETGMYISSEALIRIIKDRPPDKAILLPIEERLKIYEGRPEIPWEVAEREFKDSEATD